MYCDLGLRICFDINITTDAVFYIQYSWHFLVLIAVLVMGRLEKETSLEKKTTTLVCISFVSKRESHIMKIYVNKL